MKSTRSHSSLVLVFLVFNPEDLRNLGYLRKRKNNNCFALFLRKW